MSQGLEGGVRISAIGVHSVVNTRSGLARGLIYAEIADKLTIRPHTAETHCANLMCKLDPNQGDCAV
jgi:hypothetical protein